MQSHGVTRNPPRPYRLSYAVALRIARRKFTNRRKRHLRRARRLHTLDPR